MFLLAQIPEDLFSEYILFALPLHVRAFKALQAKRLCDEEHSRAEVVRCSEIERFGDAKCRKVGDQKDNQTGRKGQGQMGEKGEKERRRERRTHAACWNFATIYSFVMGRG